MSAGLRAAARDYLSERRARGYRLDDHEWLLGAFLDGLEACGATRITVAGALAFATARPETSRCWQAKAAAEPIPAGLINARTARRVPYLYSEEQIAQLMSAAAMLPATMLAASMQALIGLLASTGLRSGEAGALDTGDLDAAARLLTVTGKYGRIRLVALHSTTVQALTAYLQVRAGRAAPAGPLLVGEPGHRLNLTMARNIFRSLTRQCRLAPHPGCGAPRLHDFRHRFAVNTLIEAHRQGRDVDACIATQPGAHLLVPDHHPRARRRRLRAGRPVLPARATPVTALAPTVESFFTGYLIGQRGASARTIASYRDTLGLLFRHVHERTGIRPSELDVADLDAEMISGFLAALERARHNSAQTRNLRLAAIHSLFRHAALRHPEHAWSIARVLAIRPKKASQKTVAHLSQAEVEALLASPDRSTWTGRRDHLLMLVMVTSGPRVSEVTALTWADISAARPGAHVLWHGKGRKERISPLDAATTAALRLWQRENPAPASAPVFTARGTARKMTPDAVAQRLRVHAAAAAVSCPTPTPAASSAGTVSA